MSVTSFSKVVGSLIFFFPLPQCAVVACFLVADAVVVRKKNQDCECASVYLCSE